MADVNLYRDIAERTAGEIHIGIVGPARTGKSTFIKRFMELFVMPGIDNPFTKARVVDQLPQIGNGKTMTTTEPKFIPEEAVRIKINHTELDVRLVDCVGYLIPGVLGHMENDKARMVKTPWDKESMTFEAAAERGTEQVMQQHSTIGLVITTDGSIGEFPREAYCAAEEKAVEQLKTLRKPFVLLLNTAHPQNAHTKELVHTLETTYHVPVVAINCSSMGEDDMEEIFRKLLKQFPVKEVEIRLPDYMDALPASHPVKQSLIESVLQWMQEFFHMESVEPSAKRLEENEFVQNTWVESMEMATGRIFLQVQLNDGLYYYILGELLGRTVENEKELFLLLEEYAKAKAAYDDLAEALSHVQDAGYGIVQPKLTQMELGKPEVFKQGNKYGVRLLASGPCLHLIKTTVDTEISPIVGNQQQSEDLAGYLMEKYDMEADPEEIWNTNLFGKTLKQLVMDQMDSKLRAVPDTLQFKVQRSLQKISNDGKDYFICIIL